MTLVPRPAVVIAQSVLRFVQMAALGLIALQCGAQSAPAGLSDGDRRAVVDGSAQVLRERYVYPDVGVRAAKAIEAALATGEYANIDSPAALATRLTSDLEQITHDKHLFVSPPYDGTAKAGAANAPPPLPAMEGGVTRADRLPGNIGYIELFAFAPLGMFQVSVDRALAKLADCRALIIDIRRNIGGDPESVDYLLSYLVSTVPIRIGTSTSRTPGSVKFTTQEYWIRTKPSVSFAGKPVFVLMGSGTYSGGEALAYSVKELKLGTLVGETTAGAANVTNSVMLAQGYSISVPYARSSATTWEGVGVRADLASTSQEALPKALARLGEALGSTDIKDLSRSRVFTPRTTAAPGSEAAVRRMAAEIQRGEPRYELMNEVMANALRQRLPTLQKMLADLGAIKSVSFLESNWIYGDIFRVQFANGSVNWAVGFDSHEKIAMWEVRPTPTETPQ